MSSGTTRARGFDVSGASEYASWLDLSLFAISTPGGCVMPENWGDLPKSQQQAEIAKNKHNSAAKALYDGLNENGNKETGTNELLIEGFDHEQIWAQMEILNQRLTNSLTTKLNQLLARASTLPQEESDDELEENAEPEESDEESEESEGTDAEISEEEGIEEEDDNSEEEVDEEFEEEMRAERKKRNIGEDDEEEQVDSEAQDHFFNSDELEKFANFDLDEDEDSKGDLGDLGQNTERDKDLLIGEVDDDNWDAEQDPGIKYSDFFEEEKPLRKKPEPELAPKPAKEKEKSEKAKAKEKEHTEPEPEQPEADPKTKSKAPKLKEKPSKSPNPADKADIDDLDESDEPAREKTPYEQHVDKLFEKIKKLEDANVAEKDWTLRGEVEAKDRPENSLLETVLEFEQPLRGAPIITPEVQNSLEDIIKRRIKEESWDDIVKKSEKHLPQETPPDISQRKSKLGLAEIYENEYKKQVLQEKAEDPLADRHLAMNKLFTSLVLSLDALSNLHYVPKPAEEPEKVKVNAPALAAEEAVPVAASTSSLVAPEEVYQKPAHATTKEELTPDDRQRLHRHAKSAQKKELIAKHGYQLSKAKKSASYRKKLQKEKALADFAAQVAHGTHTVATAPAGPGGDGATAAASSKKPAGRMTSTKFFGILQDHAAVDAAAGTKRTAARLESTSEPTQKKSRAAQLRL
ncbi:U3 small nucleolar ribonucleoprotein MPP10 [Pelomyxa schiedti]|nr:U3 small nucleolar ribonucleoprotein MPP10 [Pelomyxa schiedti]